MPPSATATESVPNGTHAEVDGDNAEQHAGIAAALSNGSLPPLFDHPIDDYRPLKIVCIGGGISGILAAIRFPQRLKNIELVIYEKNAEVGGTWFENRYPGVRCDIPSASYQYTFESNTQWSEYYASGPEIQRYLLKVADKYGVRKYMRFRHQFKGAAWDAARGKWDFTIEDLDSGNTFADSADIYISATGILNTWQWPKIDGFWDYKGKVVHSANWDQSVTWDDKDVAVIGAGTLLSAFLPAGLAALCSAEGDDAVRHLATHLLRKLLTS